MSRNACRAIRCVNLACGWKSERQRNDGGGFGRCTRCGGRMQLQTALVDRKAAQAKTDLARYERPAAAC